MPNLRNIIHQILQKMGAFLFSWDALIFCLFCLLSTGIWFVSNLNKTREANKPADYSGMSETIVYTEKTIEATIVCTNVPAGEKMITFPDHVEITARIPLSNYNTLTAADFRCECAYPIHDADQISVQVSCTNKEVASFHFEPEAVEYIIEKTID